MPDKPTVAVDLDGVLASYDGWRGIDHFGEPIEGAREFLRLLREDFEVVIYTTRTAKFNAPEGDGVGMLHARVYDWLVEHQMPFDKIHEGDGKPLCVALIDDRAVACRPQVDGPSAFARARAMAAMLAGKTEWSKAQADASEAQTP